MRIRCGPLGVKKDLAIVAGVFVLCCAFVGSSRADRARPPYPGINPQPIVQPPIIPVVDPPAPFCTASYTANGGNGYDICHITINNSDGTTTTYGYQGDFGPNGGGCNCGNFFMNPTPPITVEKTPHPFDPMPMPEPEMP